MNGERGISFRFLIGIGILLAILLLAGQTLCLFDYELTVSLGLQESVHEITDIGIAFAKGYAFGDTLVYLPLLIFGIIGLIKGRAWGLFLMFGAMAITVYWPATNLYTIYAGKGSMNLNPDKYIYFPILLSLFSLYGLWVMWYLYKNRSKFK